VPVPCFAFIRTCPMPTALPPPSHRILVTGGSGFLGRHIVRQLLVLGHHVSVLDIRSLPDTLYSLPYHSLATDDALTDPAVHGRLTFIDGSITDPVACDAACLDQDIVIHCASLVNNAGTPEEMQQVNITGTKCILHAARHNQVKAFIHTSSVTVAFHLADVLDGRETDPYTGCDAYTYTKRDAEQWVLRHAHRHPFPRVCVLRPPGIFGPGDPVTWPEILSNHRRGGTRIYYGRDPPSQWVYVEDAADAHIFAAFRALESYERYQGSSTTSESSSTLACSDTEVNKEGGGGMRQRGGRGKSHHHASASIADTTDDESTMSHAIRHNHHPDIIDWSDKSAGPDVHGRVYIISDPTLTSHFQLFRDSFVHAARPTHYFHYWTPYPAILCVAYLCLWMSYLLRFITFGLVNRRLLVTPNDVRYGNTAFVWRSDRARRELGWTPPVGYREGVKRTGMWFKPALDEIDRGFWFI